MRFTSEDLMKAMGLSIGNKVKVKCIDEKFNETFETYEIKQQAGDTYLQSIDDGFIDSLAYLIDQEIEILPRPKRVGELNCDGNCKNCPLMSVCSWDSDYQGKNLYGVLDYELVTIHDDKEIYDLLKSRLDKEVE